MRRLVQSAVVVSIWALTGCAVQTDGAGDEFVGTDEEGIELGDVIARGDLVLTDGGTSTPTPAATLVLYSEAGLWRDTLVQNATPSGNAEAVNLIGTSQIQSANLYGRVSRFRLICGTRDAYVVLFRNINNGTSLHDWSEFSTGHAFSCKANETVSIDLHQQAPELADQVGSVYLVSHARVAEQVPFSAFVASNWNLATRNLPGGASADGPGRFKLDGHYSFLVRQFLRVDSWACEERGAIFGLRAIMNTANRTFNVEVNEVYVDTGVGDSWGCRDKMTAAVRDGARDAALSLTSGLNDLAALAGTHPRYYFVPGFTMREFDIVGGGDRQLPPGVGNLPVLTATKALR